MTYGHLDGCRDLGRRKRRRERCSRIIVTRSRRPFLKWSKMEQIDDRVRDDDVKTEKVLQVCHPTWTTDSKHLTREKHNFVGVGKAWKSRCRAGNAPRSNEIDKMNGWRDSGEMKEASKGPRRWQRLSSVLQQRHQILINGKEEPSRLMSSQSPFYATFSWPFEETQLSVRDSTYQTCHKIRGFRL